MIESVMTRMSAEVLCFEIRLPPPPAAACIGQTCRLPFEVIRPYLSGRPLRFRPWHRPEPPLRDE
jgi:hypothetical protein